MINDNVVAVLRQALLIADLEGVRTAALAAVSTSEELTTEQKLAVRVAAAGLAYHGPSVDSVRHLAEQVMTMDWQSSENVPALTTQQREAILATVVAVSKTIIDTEATRLQSLVALDTDPEPDDE